VSLGEASGLRAALVVPALDEAGAIGEVVRGFLHTGRLARVVVADNGSRDATAAIARDAGAEVVTEPARGYGRACLAALAHLARTGAPDVVVFADGDGACAPADLPALLAPLEAGRADLVVGSRVRRAAPGALTPPQRFGNALASAALTHVYGVRTTDLGPFRAIRWAALERLAMEDPTYGWTVEMQVKAAVQGLRVVEVDVAHGPRRAGTSKVSGTVRGVWGAGRKIVGVLVRHGGARRGVPSRRGDE
jgi:glycosyltransferase involved in cell wall biosynthesis